MKNVNSLKNDGVNVMADNAGEKKKILDGCKFCMEKRGFKCDKAGVLFNHRAVLSSYSPCYHGVRFDVQDPPKPLEFPLRCFRNFAVEGLHCVSCNITYKARYDAGIERYDTTCPICGSDTEEFVNKYGDYYAYNTSYLSGLYCHDCGIVYCERYNLKDHEVISNSNCPHCGKHGQHLSDMIDKLYPNIYTDENNTHDWIYSNDEEYLPFYDEEIEKYYIERTFFRKSKMSTREIMVALDLVESIFCGQQHPTNEENYQRDVEFFRTYEADDAYRLTPCYGNCDSMCELCPINGHEKEYVFNNICSRLNYMKESLQHERPYLRSLYMELLDIMLVLNQVAGGRLDKFVSLIREACIRMDENEVDACVALVVSLFETAKALARVDTSYMRAKDDIEVIT